MPLKLGTRGSKLALAQSCWVANQLTNVTGLPVELVVINTRGDRIIDRPLAAVGGKGLFTLELEEALRSGTIDFAVHSLKDLPVEDPDGLITACIPHREDPRDVIVGLAEITKESTYRLGTGSPRRQAQLTQLFPGAELVGIRGNIDTRVSKALAGEVDAVVLAQAGLNRLGGFDHLPQRLLEPFECIPAPGQGALAIQCVAHKHNLIEELRSIHCSMTTIATQLERLFLSQIGGGCHAAVGALAVQSDDHWQLNVMHSRGVGHPCIYKQYLGATVDQIEEKIRAEFSALG